MDEFRIHWQEEDSPREPARPKIEPVADPYVTLENSLSFLDLKTVAKRPRSTKNWLPSHKNLLLKGVKAGDCFKTTDNRNYISVVGYINRGFFFLPRVWTNPASQTYTQNWKPNALRDRTIRDIIHRGERVYTVAASLLDKDGFSKPGRELDVALASLQIPASVWDFGEHRRVHISFCSAGHYHFTTYPKQSGFLCKEEECIASQQSAEADLIIHEVLSEAIETCTSPMLNRPWKTTTSPSSNYGQFPTVEPYTRARLSPLQTPAIIDAAPGSIIPLRSSRENIVEALVSKRKCGYIHAEILSGDYSEGPYHSPNGAFASLGRCDKCDKPGIVFACSLSTKKSTFTRSKPVDIPLAAGELVLDLKRQFPIAIRDVQGNKALGYSSDKKLITMSISDNQYKHLDHSDKAFSEHGLIKFAPVSFLKWMRAITAGTRLRKKDTGQTVTCLCPPVKVGMSWLVRTLEHIRPCSLENLALFEEPPVSNGDIVEAGSKKFIVTKIGDQVSLSDQFSRNVEVSLLGFSILFELNFIRHSKLLYTVNSLTREQKGETT